MANQMIALQARAPQTDFLGNAIQRNAQMMNMMSQQRAAERQAAQAAQTMEFQAAEEARKAALHTPAMTKATAEAQAAQIETAMDFNNFVRVGLQYAQSPDQVIDIARKIAAQPQFKDDYFQHAIQVALQDMPSDPSQFPAWKDKTRFDTLSTDKQLSQKLIELTSGGETWTTAVPEYAGSGRAPAEVQGTRQKAPVGITYVRGPSGEIIPMPKEATPGGLVGGERGGGGGYDVVYGFGGYAKPDKPLTSMTLGEVQDFQRNKLIPATRGKVGAGPDKGTGAVGKYQIVYSTLQEYAPKVLGADWKSQPFTAEAQERIAEAIYNDVRGGNLKNTWAGLPNNKPGEYANVPWAQVRDKIAQVESGGEGGATTGVQMGQVLPGTDLEIREKESKTRAAAGAAGTRYDRMIKSAEDLLNSPQLDTIIGNVQGNIPETALSLSSQGAANALALYNTLVVRGGFNELQSLRDASPTGGALGQVTDRENAMLQQAAATLSRTQDEATFRQRLRNYINELKASKQRVEQAWERDFGRPFSAGSRPLVEPRGGAAPRNAPAAPPARSGKRAVRTGVHKGRRVVEYSDGSVEYAD